MADMRLTPSVRVLGAGSATQPVPIKGMKDGTIFNADWLARMALEGRMYTIHAGTGTAPITGAGVYVNTTPDLDMSVPANQVVIPTKLVVNYETVGTSGIQECVAAIGVGGVLAPTSQDAVSIVNHRLDLSNASGVTAVATATGATYMTSNVLEFFRNSPPMGITKTSQSATVTSIDPYRFQWSALETGDWPIMYNTSSITRLNVFMGGQAPTGFITLTFVVPELLPA
jgi:hypothetical protein